MKYSYGQQHSEIDACGDSIDRTHSLAKVTLPEPCHCAAEASSYIRVQDGLFVDEECKEFMFSGYNAWEVGTLCLPAVCSRQCAQYRPLQMLYQMLYIWCIPSPYHW